MKHKIFAIFVTLLMVLSTISLFTDDDKVIATSGGSGGSEEDIGLDFQYIWNITDNLSKIIYIAYNDTDLEKGRFFGSDGEHYAAFNILQDEMIEMGLYNPCLDSEYPYLEQIQNITSKFDLTHPGYNLTDDIDTLSMGLTIHNESTNKITDFHIAPMWNNRFWKALAEYIIYSTEGDKPNLSQMIECLKDFIKETFSNWTRTNMIFNDSWLTKNVSYENLSLFRAPTSMFWFLEVLEYQMQNISSNESIVDLQSFLHFFIPKFQDYHKFNFSEVNETNGNNLTWFNATWNASQRCNNFLFVREDNSFNPNPPENQSWIRQIKEMLKNHSVDPLFEPILRAVYILEHYLWSCRSLGHFKGEIRYNFDNDTYNMEGSPLDPSNILYINGSIGKPMYEDIYDYKVTFWINQSWKTDIESYNVIGQINGTDQSKTVIVSCLYDSWWNQGTGDSAIGMAIVLGIAKYFQDNGIKPKYNLKFIGFAGEEAGLRGAYHYEGKHWDENVIMVIDMNQVGFHHDGPPLVLNLIYNNESLYSTFSAIANVTEYENRIGDETTKLNVTDVHILSDYTPFDENRSENCSTICFLKDLGWIYHHRSGDNHTEGDSMKYYNETDVRLTTELVWNVTKYFCVNPNCSFESVEYTYIDTDDNDTHNDSIRVNFTAKTILPHDKLMANATLRYNSSKSVQSANIMNFSENSDGKSISMIVTLPEGKEPGHCYLHLELLNSTGIIDFTLNPDGSYANQSDNNSMSSDWLYPYNYNLYVPNFSNFSYSPNTLGYGFNVSLSVDVYPNLGGPISNVSMNVTYPDKTLHNFTMNNTLNDTYEYMFNDTWKYGNYYFYIWAEDVNGNVSGTNIYCINVDAELNITVCTIKDEYGGDEIVNLTDPPGNPYKVGYEFLDEGKVLHIWNRFDSYYFNTSNGIQFTNHKDDYWSTNVLMLGYYDNDFWNLIYRTDELSGFNKNILSDNETFVNATLWKDLSYQGYDFRLAIRYYLGVDDNELTVIPYIKNIDDVNITYNLGFAWELKDIQVDMTNYGDYIEIDGTSYFLNQSLDETYTDLDNPCFYIKEDKTSNNFESLYLRWDENLNYKVKVETSEGQYNAPVTLGIKIGTLNVGQEKYTSLFWHDASEIIYYFDDYAVAEAWATNPGYMVDSNVSNFASTSISEDSERCNNNSCDGSYLGNISKVELRCNASFNTNCVNLKLKPIYNGNNPGSYIIYTPEDYHQWSDWLNVPGDLSGIPDWTWSEIENLDFFVDADYSRDSFTLYCSKVELRVTYTPKYASGISNPVPEDGSIGISIVPTLSINVSDVDGDNMTLTWYSNSSGSWQPFGINSSVGNGTYEQVFSNASVNGQWWYWNVSLDDGEVVNNSDIFSFYTGCESKIYNTGDTNISGYLNIIVEYYNTSSEDWETEMVVIDKSFVVINSGEILGLDTIFNAENVNTSSFTHGNGTYRVFAMLQDPYGNYLFDGTLGFVEGADDLKAWYEFTVTYD